MPSLPSQTHCFLQAGVSNWTEWSKKNRSPWNKRSKNDEQRAPSRLQYLSVTQIAVSLPSVARRSLVDALRWGRRRSLASHQSGWSRTWWPQKTSWWTEPTHVFFQHENHWSFGSSCLVGPIDSCQLDPKQTKISGEKSKVKNHLKPPISG